MDKDEIEKYIGNKFPFLFVDKITEIIPGKSAKGYKNLTINEWYFLGHYAGHMNMPGVLQIETLLEVFSMAIGTSKEYEGQQVSEVRLNNVFFRHEVLPGDTLMVEAEIYRCKRGVASGKAIGYVDGKVVCEAEIVTAISAIAVALQPK